MKPNASNRASASLLVALSVALIIFPVAQLEPYAKSQAATLKVLTEERPQYVPGQLLVKFKGNPSSQLLHQYRLQLKDRLDLPRVNRSQPQSLASNSRTYLVTFDESQAAQEVAAQVRTQEGVEYAEPNYLYSLQLIPNDPLYRAPPNGYSIDGQWAPKRIGLESVWPEKTSTEMVIINLDTGVDVYHPDLNSNLWKNPGEIPDNGIDDDGNGYIDDVYGWNVIDNNGNVQDHFGHGTNVSGIGAVGNNGIGTTGVSWQCQMMTVKVGRDTDGSVNLGDAIKGIAYASATLARQGKRGVFNASFGGLGRSQTFANAIRDAGMLFVAGSGNSGNTNPNGIYYPAGYNSELANVLSVTGSTYDEDDRLLSGASWLGSDLAAPAAWIATTELGGGYGHRGGTSFAAPHMAHALAMMLDLTNGDPLAAKARILKSVDICPALVGVVKTGGRLNIDRAFHGRFNPNQPPTASMSATSFSVGEGDVLPLTLSVSDPDGDPVTVTWDFGDGAHAVGAAVSHVYQNIGVYSIAATATDGLASVTIASTVTVTDAVRIIRVKFKKYDSVAGIAKKLSVTATDSHQSQTPRPMLTIIGLGEMSYDEDSQAYTFNLKKAKNMPPALIIKSSLGGETTRVWQ